MSRRHIPEELSGRPLCGSSSSRMYEFSLPWEFVKYHACAKCVALFKAFKVDIAMGEDEAALVDLSERIGALKLAGLSPEEQQRLKTKLQSGLPQRERPS